MLATLAAPRLIVLAMRHLNVDIVNAARFIGGNLAVGVDKALEWETMIENCLGSVRLSLRCCFVANSVCVKYRRMSFFFKTEDNELRPFRDAIVSAC